MSIVRSAPAGHVPLLALAASLALFFLLAAPVSAQSTADSLDSACALPEGESAEAIVRRVEKRLDGNWDLATKTLRQTIARQQRLGEDSAPAEAYLKSITCLQSEVDSGRHNAFLEANGGEARLAGGSSSSLVSQAPPTQPYVAPLPDAGDQPEATSAPADLLAQGNEAGGAAGAPAAGLAPSPAPSQTAAAAVPPPPASTASVPPPQNQPTRQVPQVRNGLILPGTPESYALLGNGQVAGTTTVPAVRSVDGSNQAPQGGYATAPAYNQRPLAVPPAAPKARAASLQELASRGSAVPASQPAPAVQAAPPPAASQEAAPQEAASASPAAQSVRGDPRYVNKACLYFTRPELEVIRGRVYTNRYLNGARVCHEGTMYSCDGGLWSVQGACSAFPDGQSLDSTVVEANPRR